MGKEVKEDTGKGNGPGCSLEGQPCSGFFSLRSFTSLLKAVVLGEVSGEDSVD